ncbi:MAG: hypothetical protein LBL01_00205 [Bifidobacteriaceae bacterium]|jgi:shikimate dehydrogenase|nr:hypothetical protein [Bifidobacteriaceae bacterium]
MRRAAVLGSPIAHSLSPALHRAAYRALGLRDWTYEAIDVPEDRFPGWFAGLGPEWAGLSLTMPLKRVAPPLLDHVEPLARAVGGVNTVLVTPAGTVGANTDVHGIVAAVREALPDAAPSGPADPHAPFGGAGALGGGEGKNPVGGATAGAARDAVPHVPAAARVPFGAAEFPGGATAALAGTGAARSAPADPHAPFGGAEALGDGAARDAASHVPAAARLSFGAAEILGGGATAAAALAAAAELGVGAVRVHARSMARSRPLLEAAARMGARPELRRLTESAPPELWAGELVVSTLPPRAADPLAQRLRAARMDLAGRLLLDVAYEPWPSELASAWRDAGGTVVSGKAMLLHQAAEQVRLMTGRPAPLEAMRAAIEQRQP